MVLRDPAVLLLEIGWRWSFGAIALFLIFTASSTLLSAVEVSQADRAGWRSNDPTLMAQAVANVLTQSRPALLERTAWVLPAVTFVWVAFRAKGRTTTVNRLGRKEVSFRSVLALDGSRAFVTWLAMFAFSGALSLSQRIAFRSPNPDLFLYYALAFWSLILIGAIWATANWYLSVAALCCLESGAGFLKGTNQAVNLARAHGGELGGISLIFAVLRIVALATAFALCFLPSGLMTTSPHSYLAWTAAVSLTYFAVADFLFIARMAAYLIVARPVLVAGAAETW
jgi:hypothetical protein